MKKMKLLMPILSATAITMGVAPLTCCSSGETKIEAEVDTKNGTAIVSEIQLNKQFTITYAPDSGYVMDEVKITVGNKQLTEKTDYVISNNMITVKATAVTDKSISIKITAKEQEVEPIITPVITTEKGTAVTSEIKLNKGFTIVYAPNAGYAMDEVSIKIGDYTLEEGKDYVISNNVIAVNADVVTSTEIAITITAKEVEPEEDPYVKEHTYLDESTMIKVEVNAISHNIKFTLKNALSEGQKLRATVIEDEDFDKILKSKTTDITDRIYGNDFYAPVEYSTTYLSATKITKFNLKVECYNESTNAVVWTDTYKDMYIKFTALNAWAGWNYNGYTTDITRMDNCYFKDHLSEIGVEKTLAARTMPFPIVLRNRPTDENNLRAIVYDSNVYIKGQPVTTVKFGLLSEVKASTETAYNWVRSTWDSTHNWYNYSWEQNTAANVDIRRDQTDTKFMTSFDVNVGFSLDEDTGGLPEDRVYASFNLLVYEVDASENVLWHENFSGCRLTFIAPNDDAR